jgi:peptide/nickel transport system permease protein
VVRYALYRILILAFLLVGLSIASFLYMQLVPGDPVAGMLGPAGNPELIAQLRHEFGLDRPLVTQYWSWLSGAVHGDFGISFSSRQPVGPILIHRIPATLQLTIASMIWVVLIGWPAGFFAALRKNTWIDRVFSVLALIGLSTPFFWLGTVLILILSVKLHWLPSGGYVPLTEDPVESIRLTIMPSLALGLGLAPYLARMTRASTIEVQQEQYVSHAHAKGLTRRRIAVRYTGRNAVLPIVVVLGLQLGLLLGGQVIIEELFNWPGVGRLLVGGAIQRDYFMVQAVVLVLAALYGVLNLGAELVHAWLDPRIRM